MCPEVITEGAQGTFRLNIRKPMVPMAPPGEGSCQAGRLYFVESAYRCLNYFIFKANFESYKLTRVKIVSKITVITLCFLY